MSFGSPLSLLALTVVPALAWLAVWLERRPGRHAVAFTNLDVLAPLVPAPRRLARWLPLALFLLAAASAGVALARPQLAVTGRDEGKVVLLLVDVSGSMDATDVKPSRLSAAEGALDEFVAHVPDRVRLGLISFNEATVVVVAPTSDRAQIVRGVRFLAAGGETAIGDALATAVEVARQEPAGARRRGRPSTAIVLLSDGAQDTGTLSPLRGAVLARAAGIPVYTVAFGTRGRPVAATPFDTYGLPVGFAPDPETLATIAATTGGRTYRARTAGVLADTYRRLSLALTRTPENRQIAGWFSGAAALLLLGSLGASRLRWPALP